MVFLTMVRSRDSACGRSPFRGVLRHARL